jgi:hypothetical protein
LLLGILTELWKDVYDSKSSNDNKTNWISKIIKLNWTQCKERWHERCLIYDSTKNTNEQITSLYSQYHNLGQVDKRLLLLPIDTRLNQKLTAKIAWVTRTNHQGVKRSSNQIKHRNNTIKKFFATKLERLQKRVGILGRRPRYQKPYDRHYIQGSIPW